MSKLEDIAKKLIEKPRGILAADESVPTIGTRFAAAGIEKNTEENRKAYREMLFTTPGLEKYINGVIMNEETLDQTASNDKPLIGVLEEKGIIPGVKVDKGIVGMPNYPKEKITQGLDGLRERLKNYANQGVKFTKWRAVYSIGEGRPSEANIIANAYGLAAYAAFSQEQGLVAIPEPEVLIDGSHNIEKCFEATNRALNALFEYLDLFNVALRGIVLKPNMVVPGKDHPKGDYTSEVVSNTISVLLNNVPNEVPGIAFLSGGLDEDAMFYLNAMNMSSSWPSRTPWNLTFSFARALQNAAMEEFAKGNIELGQKKLIEIAKQCSLATEGKYKQYK